MIVGIKKYEERAIKFTAYFTDNYNMIVAEQARVATPTATETMLPWKREEAEGSGALKQSEFPSWASNKEYLAYNSPSSTFLGKSVL